MKDAELRNTFNKFGVGVRGDMMVIPLASLATRITKADALILAAWLVALASDDPVSPDGDFLTLLREVLNT